MRLFALVACLGLVACASPAADERAAEPRPDRAYPGTRASGVVAEPADLDAGGVDAASLPADPDAMPLVRVPPSGFEGCLRGLPKDSVATVTVLFDVTADGRPVNIRVTEATDACFERSTIRAVAKWRYAPKIVDDRAMPRRGVLTTVSFQMG